MAKVEIITNKKKDEKIFKNTAKRIRKKNLIRTNTRGGVRM